LTIFIVLCNTAVDVVWRHLWYLVPEPLRLVDETGQAPNDYYGMGTGLGLKRGGLTAGCGWSTYRVGIRGSFRIGLKDARGVNMSP